MPPSSSTTKSSLLAHTTSSLRNEYGLTQPELLKGGARLTGHQGNLATIRNLESNLRPTKFSTILKHYVLGLKPRPNPARTARLLAIWALQKYTEAVDSLKEEREDSRRKDPKKKLLRIQTEAPSLEEFISLLQEDTPERAEAETATSALVKAAETNLTPTQIRRLTAFAEQAPELLDNTLKALAPSVLQD